ncbi:unnamed protein product [Dibothriocephalus latus]|uniref:RNA-binding protein 5 n=1 Tax=Dibothriocephalus latus TaxID=60516 RepID=A0A3P7NTF6_DIBLA|nr:unnamed protein product [Dibothriocephalus latus]
MDPYDGYRYHQRECEDDRQYMNSGMPRARSPFLRTMDTVSSTIILRGMSTSITDRDLRYALEDERARYTDIRLVKDRKTGISKGMAFVDFCSPDDARRFMRDCHGELEIRGYSIKMNFSAPRDERDEERFQQQPPFPSSSKFVGRSEPPSSTIMMRGLPSSLEERDVIDVLDRDGVRYVDVRVIRDKNTGKGFGFIEFASVEEARQWMEIQKEVLRVRRNDLRLMFSSPRYPPEMGRNLDAPPSGRPVIPALSSRFGPPNDVSTGDWICSRCSSHNFRRRDQCYRCQLPRSQSQTVANSSDGSDLIGATPCNTLILRCLDALTTEDSIRQAFQDIADVKVRQCHVMRDDVTHVSRCFAFAELPNVADAYKVVDTIVREHQLFEIEGKAVAVSYAKNTFNTIMATLKAEGSYNAKLNASRSLSSELSSAASNNIDSQTVAKNAVAAGQYTNSMDGIAVAQAAIQQKQTEAQIASVIAKSIHQPGDITQAAATVATFPLPTMPFNAATAATTVYRLLYEPNTRYFFDRATQEYFYYEASRSTYIPASQVAAMNETSKTADTGYAILQATSSTLLNQPGTAAAGLVAHYGGEDSDESNHAEAENPQSQDNRELEAQVAAEESKLMDWAKLACLLCSRGFKDVETMQKHRSFSNLHIQNFNKLRAKYGLKPTSAAASQYRDRAKERREKFGLVPPAAAEVRNASPPGPPVIIEPVPAAPPAPDAPNVGSLLMQKMGWQAGQGLGKANQGRTQLVEAEFREAGVGLGIKTSKRQPPADNYKDNVKRAMFARYHEIE